MKKSPLKKLLILTIVLTFSLILSPKVLADLNTDYVELKVTFTKSNGSTCDVGTDCTSGNCVDGYCCDTTCTGGCESCALSGTEGTCTTRTSGDNTECDPCNYCDGTNTTCQFVSDGTDPYGDCTANCTDSCTLEGDYCDGAGSCDSSYCSAGTACSSGSCLKTNYCNTTWALSSCLGNGCYNDGGSAYNCQAQCDGGGTCDYSANCTGTGEVADNLYFDGYFEISNMDFDFTIPGPCDGQESLSYGGQTYNLVEIGDQCWFAESLNVTDGNEDGTCTFTRSCYNDTTSNCTTYGGLYTWSDAMCGTTSQGTQGICPNGWQIPTDGHLYTIENYLTESGNTCSATRFDSYDCDPAGAKMAGNSGLWTSGTLTNSSFFGESGFDALPSGGANSTGQYSNIDTRFYLWTSSEDSANAWVRQIDYANTDIYRVDFDKGFSFPIRCLKAFCSTSSDYNSTTTIDGDVVYCDADGEMWTPTGPSTYDWDTNTQDDESDDSCIGKGSDYQACHYCDTLNYAGYTDWYLPSCTDTSNMPDSCKLYQFGVDNCNWSGAINGSESSCAPSWDTNAQTSNYWSSSEGSQSLAYYVFFGTGWTGTENKSWDYYVRCIRDVN